MDARHEIIGKVPHTGFGLVDDSLRLSRDELAPKKGVNTCADCGQEHPAPDLAGPVFLPLCGVGHLREPLAIVGHLRRELVNT
jgi:hypothetical protein